MKTTLAVFIIAFLFFGCSLFRPGHLRIKQDKVLLLHAAQSVLRSGLESVIVSSLSRCDLKKELKNLKVEKVSIYYAAPQSFYADSTVVFSRTSFPLRIEEVIVDFGKERRDLGGDGLEEMHDRIYFRSFVPIS